MDGLIEIGTKEETGQEDYLLKKAKETNPAQPAMLLTTSGTTALPKLSILSHENLIFSAESYAKVTKGAKGDELLSAAPLAWIGEQMYNLTQFLKLGTHYNFPEETNYFSHI